MDLLKHIDNSLRYATNTREFVIGSEAIKQLPEVIFRNFKTRSVLIIADLNTYDAAGKRVMEILTASGLGCELFLIEEDHFHAEWKYVEMVETAISRYSGHIIIAVGSGVINDLCKIASYRKGTSYLCVPTAASVDGFSSFGASISYQGIKQTFECPAPIAIVADTDIISKAPKIMTAAGYADLAAKIPASAEWMIADLFGTEPFLPVADEILYNVLDDLLEDPQGVASGDSKAIDNLFAGLTLSGIAMQAAKSSRPASCSDHLFSHYLDMTGHTFKGKSVSHGFQVAIGTLTMCAVLEELFKFDLSTIDVDKCVAQWPTLEQEQARALKVFKDFPAKELGYIEITKKYSDADTVRCQLIAVREQWTRLKAEMQRRTYSFDRMQALFKKVGAPSTPEEIGITKAELRAIVPFVQLMRWRINVFDLAKRACIYDELVSRVFDTDKYFK